MAIENVWIIDGTSGICIYDWCVEGKEKTIDEQLVSGLLIAFKNFSSEAGLVDISAIEGIDRKLAYKSDERFIIASICHSNDYEPLINKTLLGLLKRFQNKYQDILKDGSTTDVSPFRTFDEDVLYETEEKISERTKTSTIVGSITSLVIMGAVFLALLLIFSFTEAALFKQATVLIFVIFLVAIFSGGLAGGFISGNRKLGMIGSTIASIPTLVGLIFLMISFNRFGVTIIDQFFYSLLFVLVFGAMALLGGLLGGFLKDRKYFYPIIEDE